MARYRPPRRGIPLGKMTGPVAAIAVLAGLASGHAHKGPAAARSGGAEGYVNPLAGQRWELARTDQGVDYKPVAPTPVRAIGAGVVVYSSSSTGWPGGAFISYKLTSGPEAGHVIFVAEHLTGLTQAGRTVWAGEPIATAWPGYPWTEWGWAACSGDLPAVQYNGAPDGTPMPGGKAFARFMRHLGASTLQDPGPGPDVAGGC